MGARLFAWAIRSRSALVLLALLSGRDGLTAQECTTPATKPIGSVTASADLIRASTDDDKLGAAVQLTRWAGTSLCPAGGLRRHRTVLTLGSDYRARTDAAASTSITRSHRLDVAQTLMLNQDAFLQGSGQLFHNNSLGVRLQQTYRLGIGAAVGALEMGVAGAYVDQDFGDAGPAASFGAVSVHETAGWDLPYPAAGTQLTQSIRALLPVGEAGAKQVAVSVEVRAPLTSTVGVSWSLWNEYLENAPEGRERNYLRTSFGVRWSFNENP